MPRCSRRRGADSARPRKPARYPIPANCDHPADLPAPDELSPASAGAGEGSYYDFNLADFTGRFGLETSTVLDTLKVLEQEGLLSFQQQVYLPARAQFVTGKEMLYDFEKDHPELQPLIHSLLRNYEGIFDQPVPLRERQLAYNTRLTPQKLAAELAQLQAFRILEYTPSKESPQLYFFRHRPAADELYIDPVRYRERKEQYATRIRAMVRYLGLAIECCSRFGPLFRG